MEIYAEPEYIQLDQVAGTYPKRILHKSSKREYLEVGHQFMFAANDRALWRHVQARHIVSLYAPCCICNHTLTITYG